MLAHRALLVLAPTTVLARQKLAIWWALKWHMGVPPERRPRRWLIPYCMLMLQLLLAVAIEVMGLALLAVAGISISNKSRIEAIPE